MNSSKDSLLIKSALSTQGQRGQRRIKVDDFTRKHLTEWLKFKVRWQDRPAVEKKILWILEKHPELPDKGWGWGEILSLAERSDKA